MPQQLLDQDIIYHFVESEWLELQSYKSHYESATFQEEGFIHLCTIDQVGHVLSSYFSKAKRISLLIVRVDNLTAELKMEGKNGSDYFPHLYGPLNWGAVVSRKIFR